MSRSLPVECVALLRFVAGVEPCQGCSDWRRTTMLLAAMLATGRRSNLALGALSQPNPGHYARSPAPERSKRCRVDVVRQNSCARFLLFRLTSKQSTSKTCSFTRAMPEDLLTAETRERTRQSIRIWRARGLEQTDATSLLESTTLRRHKNSLHELLMKQDQMSMATSIESRVPFLDKTRMNSPRNSERLKLGGWTTKYVLRQSRKAVAGSNSFPAQDGIPVPIGSWFRGATAQ